MHTCNKTGVRSLITLIHAAMIALLIGCNHEPADANPAIVNAQKTQAATYYVDQRYGKDVNPGTDTRPWKTLTAANKRVSPGDQIVLRTGVYMQVLRPARSGSENAWLSYVADANHNVIVEGMIDLRGRSYISIKGITFRSNRGKAWLMGDARTHFITLEGNAFESPAKTVGDFGGFTLKGGHDYVIRHNKFGKWRGDLIWALEMNRVIFEHNDLSQAAGEHSLLTLNGSNLIVRNNYFRNPWDRAILIRWHGDVPAENVLVENNVVIDSDWDRKRYNPTAKNSEKGATESIRLLATRAIFRNNLVVGNRSGKNPNWYGTMLFSTFKNSKLYTTHYEKIRLYHNTFAENDNSTFVFLKNSDELYGENNHFKNNVICNFGGHAIGSVQRDIPWRTYRFESNLIYSDQTDRVLMFADVGKPVSVAQAQKKEPKVFVNNIVAQPRFKNAHKLSDFRRDPARGGTAASSTLFEAFKLAGNSPGRRRAAPLTRIIANASNSTTIKVEDALYFTDGWGLVDADEVFIGNKGPYKIESVVDDTTLRLETAVTVSTNEPVYLRQAPGGSDVGVY